MFAANRFSSRIFNFQKKQNSYNNALTFVGVKISNVNNINNNNKTKYDYSSYIYTY